MDGNQILALGLGLEAPWKLVDQHLDTSSSPHQLHLTVEANRGRLFPCPECGQACPAHDYKELTWRHLNFFQHHCFLHARTPRTRCPDHGVKRINVPWARKGSDFTLLFEQAAMTLIREMPVLAAARFMEVTDKRLWRMLEYYIQHNLEHWDLSAVKKLALDETASKRGHNYVTVFLDMDKADRPVIFAVPGRGKATVKAFSGFLKQHEGQPEQIAEVVCDMPKAFLSAVDEELPNAEVTIDWFHVVQIFNKGVGQVRKQERKNDPQPKSTRWAVLKNLDNRDMTQSQLEALQELLAEDKETGKAWIIKEKLRWIRDVKTPQQARWRLTHFINYAKDVLGDNPIQSAMYDALETLKRHSERIIRRITSDLTNARLEGMNSLFQAARARARGYRNTENFINMIYLIGSPIDVQVQSGKST